jgi:hypothetical protein
VYFTATTALPTGIALGRLYFINVLTGTTFAVYDTRADAIADTNRIQIVDSGNGADAHVYISTGEIVERTIKFVNSSTEMTMETNFPSTAQSGLNILQKTRVLLRPDGFALHRPYDGGVELIPPTNPDATMIRQTRKYFRYQSGKGIQVSFAVNFSPTSQIDTFSRSGTTGTITTTLLQGVISLTLMVVYLHRTLFMKDVPIGLTYLIPQMQLMFLHSLKMQMR